VCPEKTGLSSISQRSRLNSIKILEDLSFTQRKRSKTDCRNKFSGAAKSWRPAILGWQLPPHGYGPGVKLKQTTSYYQYAKRKIAIFQGEFGKNDYSFLI